MIQAEKREIIESAAILLAADHSDTAEAILFAAMIEVASHNRMAGAGARDAWIKSLQSLGEMCVSIARREK